MHKETNIKSNKKITTWTVDFFYSELFPTALNNVTNRIPTKIPTYKGLINHLK